MTGVCDMVYVVVVVVDDSFEKKRHEEAQQDRCPSASCFHADTVTGRPEAFQG